MSTINIEGQPIFSKLLNKINNTSTNAQAYLIVGDSLRELDFCSKLLSKILICNNKYEENCTKCNICKRIDNNEYGELTSIYPVDNTIKKEQISLIRDKYQMEAIEGKNQVYIINQADLLNKTSANMMLKFIEEPSSQTIAIFTTTNFSKVWNTIVSRCQVIKLNNNIKNTGFDYVKEITNFSEEQINYVMDFMLLIENNPSKAIIEIDNYINFFSTKDEIAKSITIMLLLYKDIFNYKETNNMQYFNDETGIKNVANKLNIKTITNKISFILKNLEKIEYNVNILLFIDNFVIGMEAIK